MVCCGPGARRCSRLIGTDALGGSITSRLWPELGRPVEETELSGGMRRAEWITNSGMSVGRALAGAGYQRRTMAVVPLEPTEIHRLRDRYLQLIFDKAGRLVAWKNGTKTGD